MRLIDADALAKAFEEVLNDRPTPRTKEPMWIYADAVFSFIQRAPTIEAIPLSNKHCSECGSKYIYLACNNCGAKMDLEDDE